MLEMDGGNQNNAGGSGKPKFGKSISAKEFLNMAAGMPRGGPPFSTPNNAAFKRKIGPETKAQGSRNQRKSPRK